MLLTTCNHCGKKFKLRPEQLEAAQGLVRCGNCKKIFQAKNSLEEIADNESNIKNAIQQTVAVTQKIIRESEQVSHEKIVSPNQSDHFEEPINQIVVDNNDGIFTQAEEVCSQDIANEINHFQNSKNMEFILKEEDFIGEHYSVSEEKHRSEGAPIPENVDDDTQYKDDVNKQQPLDYFLSESESTQVESSYGGIKRALSVDSITLYYSPIIEQQTITSEEHVLEESSTEEFIQQDEEVFEDTVEQNIPVEIKSVEMMDAKLTEEPIKNHIIDTELSDHSVEQSLVAKKQAIDTKIIPSHDNKADTDKDLELVENAVYRPLAVSDQNIYLRHQHKISDTHPYEKEFNWTIASFVAVIVLIMQMFYLILS